MKNHPLSALGKAGVPVSEGEIKDWHINEEGFLYANVYMPLPPGAEEGTKRKTCAKKLSTVQYLDDSIPEKIVVGVKYKKKANLKEPELQAFPDLAKAKGVDLVEFNAAWSATGNHMDQILTSLVKQGPLSGKFTRTTINTDHQPQDCANHNVRLAPTLILFKDGKEVGRMEGFPSEEPEKAIFDFIKKVANPKASTPKTVEKKEEAEA